MMEMIRIGGEYVARQNNHIDHRISDAAVDELEKRCFPLAALVDQRIRAGAPVYGRQLMDMRGELIAREAIEELADCAVYNMFMKDSELPRDEARARWAIVAPSFATIYRFTIEG